MRIDETLEQLRTRVGDFRRLAQAEVFERTEGAGRGSRMARLSMIGGLDLELLPDRGMDIGAASWRGTPLAWLPPSGPSAPGLLDPGSEGWRRSFGGGLLVTCGLDQFGVESADGVDTLPMHGRAHRLPASGFHAWSRQDGEDWQVGAAGQTRQSTAFDENLTLSRSVVTSLRDSALRIRDRVTNDGHTPWPHMILYHFNFGWPLICDGTTVSMVYERQGRRFDGPSPEPRDEAAARGMSGWNRIDHPPGHGPEQVFRFAFPAGATVHVTVSSPRGSLAATLSFDSDQLPYLYLWKWLGPGGACSAWSRPTARESRGEGRFAARAVCANWRPARVETTTCA